MANTSDIEQPYDKNSKIWRYMDFVQFISMLTNRGLLFRRIDKFKDPDEGFQALEHPLVIETFPENVRRAMPTDFHEKYRMSTYVNCWMLGEVQSSIMWKAFGSDSSAIAIQSRYSTLAECFDDKFHVGKVKYIQNPGLDWANKAHLTLNGFTHKGLPYTHENEVRVIMTMPPDTEKNEFWGWNSLEHVDQSHPEAQWFSVDLENLIEQVLVGPETPAWFCEAVSLTVEKLGFRLNIKPSGLFTRANAALRK